MSFPTTPTQGQIHGGYIFENDRWIINKDINPLTINPITINNTFAPILHKPTLKYGEYTYIARTYGISLGSQMLISLSITYGNYVYATTFIVGGMHPGGSTFNRISGKSTYGTADIIVGSNYNGDVIVGVKPTSGIVGGANTATVNIVPLVCSNYNLLSTNVLPTDMSTTVWSNV